MAGLLEARHAGHGDMDGGGASSMAMMMMPMVFQASVETPLYSSAWTPRSAGAYAGTCLFLVALAAVARLLLAARGLQEARWLDRDARRRYVAASGKPPLAEHVARALGAKQMTLSENGVEESVYVVARDGPAVRPWRFSVDPLRALIDTVIAGVGYLLMLAVMTMNVGYFMSVLAGVFIGSLAVGRFSAPSEH